MFKYGGFKLFLFKVVVGLILLAFGLFLIFGIGNQGLNKLEAPFGSINYFFWLF